MRITRMSWLLTALATAAVAAPGADGAGGPPTSVLELRAQTERALGSTVNPALVNPESRSGVSLLQARTQMERPLGSTVGAGVGPAAVVAAPISEPRDGFDWGDASVGGGFVAALGLLATGALTLIRRRGALA